MTEQMLDVLRSDMEKNMSPKRFRHTAEVEKMAVRLGRLYFGEDNDTLNKLRAAALLHDITKELTPESQKQICIDFGVEMSSQMESAPPTQHSYTASLLIPVLYPHLADEEIIGAVKYHTTGRADMTLAEKIIYLSDYIDCTRTFDDCVELREMFWSVDIAAMTEGERLLHLDKVLLRSFEMTIVDLKARNRQISRETAEARESLLSKINA